ncbi:glycosyltransferase family 4 protein [Flavobacterium zepuense]|uniref:Glycosyltransferase family 4 protein n=1 Tax=Flavobacterium zepuense TaxID=2593302 RepID=A0A552V2D7_9FLAO|nr:glycosyltransferase family 4 protein [Flavobacterium zepuense]TRW24634.1 glycosyltransferase family 4 protein [Flavobacterium zepuense]
MNILFLSHKFYPDVGGTEANSEFLANAFTGLGANVHLVTWTKEEGDKKFPFTVIRNPDIKELVKQHKWADVVFENSPVLRMSWLNLFIKKPLVIALNTWIGEDGKKSLQATAKFKWLARAKSVIAVSNAIKNKCWPQAVVIENAYNDKLFVNKNKDEDSKKSFVFLGRLVSDKGANMAIDAIADLKRLKVQNALLDLDINLTIIGQGADFDKLNEQVVSLGLLDNVTFAGMLTGNDLVDALNNHKYLLIPSMWEEPFGIVALEGMACGCIPVVSDGGGLPDAVGKAGVVFKRKDQADLDKSILNLIQDKNFEERLKKEAPAHLHSHSTEIVAQKYFNLIQQALKP